MNPHYQRMTTIKFGWMLLIVLILLAFITPNYFLASAASSPANQGPGSIPFDPLDPQPTPTPEGELELQIKRLPLPPFSPTDRGIDPSSLIVNLYDAEGLQDSVRTLRWREPISFRKECWGEDYPYRGC